MAERTHHHRAHEAGRHSKQYLLTVAKEAAAELLESLQSLGRFRVHHVRLARLNDRLRRECAANTPRRRMPRKAVRS